MLQVTIPVGEPRKVIIMLFGGPGTINATSWSLDSTQIALVNYRMVRR